MNNYEEQFEKETGLSATRTDIFGDIIIGNYNAEFIFWLKLQLERTEEKIKKQTEFMEAWKNL